jgi:hypothetical protein
MQQQRQSAAGRRPRSARQLPAFARGEVLLLNGLVSRGDLNGKRCIVLEDVEAASGAGAAQARVAVGVLDERNAVVEKMRVRAFNVRTALDSSYLRLVLELPSRGVVCGVAERPALPQFVVASADTVVGGSAWPLPAAELEALLCAAADSPFGRGAETLVDPSVRVCKEVSAADLVLVDGGAWAAVLDTVVRQVEEQLFPHADLPQRRLAAQLYKLLVYGPNGFFARHGDTQRSPGHVATLVVTLPSQYAGGRLVVGSGEEEVAYDHAALAAGSGRATFCAFFCDIPHHVETVTSGHLVRLTYNLVLVPPQPRVRGLAAAAPLSSSVQVTASGAALPFCAALQRALQAPQMCQKSEPRRASARMRLADKTSKEGFSAQRLALGFGLVGEASFPHRERFPFQAAPAPPPPEHCREPRTSRYTCHGKGDPRADARAASARSDRDLAQAYLVVPLQHAYTETGGARTGSRAGTA